MLFRSMVSGGVSDKNLVGLQKVSLIGRRANPLYCFERYFQDILPPRILLRYRYHRVCGIMGSPEGEKGFAEEEGTI